MGNKATKPEVPPLNDPDGGGTGTTPEPEKPPAPFFPDDGYKWPNSIYEEARDIGAVSFLVYIMGEILDTHRKEENGLAGLGDSPEGQKGRIYKGPDDHGKDCPLDLARSFTPSEIKKIVEANIEALAKHHPAEFKGKELDELIAQLEAMEERSKQTWSERPLTLEQYDDKHQQHELVYGIGKDDINKRVTLAFRGTDVKFAAQTNWTTNLTALKKTVDIPDEIKGKVEGSDKISFHAGFHDYVFDLTLDDSDEKDKKKYDEILEDVKHVLGKYPDYKLYVTGHSLGGALSTVAAFYLSCDPDIPKPVSCINFAAPRVGDWDFFQATQALEEMGKARFLQVFADGDLVSTLPSIGYYHVGFQLKLYKSVKSKPNFLYPNKNSSWSEGVLRAWSNSVFSNFNFSYDHGDHLARLEKDKAVLEKINLNDSYADFELTGLTPKRYGQDSDSTKERSLNSEPTTGLCCGGSS